MCEFSNISRVYIAQRAMAVRPCPAYSLRNFHCQVNKHLRGVLIAQCTPAQIIPRGRERKAWPWQPRSVTKVLERLICGKKFCSHRHPVLGGSEPQYSLEQASEVGDVLIANPKHDFR